MNKSWKHATLTTLTTLLVALPVLIGFGAPVHADATSCLAGLLLNKAKSTATTITAEGVATAAETTAATAEVANEIISVPTADAGVVAAVDANTAALMALFGADAEINADTAAQTTGHTIQRCIVEPLVTIMARALLDQFTASTINWINSGFQGSPLYVTNIKGFLAGAADQAAGQFIQGLGPIGSILCSPFDLQLRLSLGLQYSPPGYYQYIGCRLTDIQQNIQRAFTGGTFGKNGWDSWIQVSAYPQNNPYGAYLKAVDSIDDRIAGTQFSLTKELDFGKGFLSSRDPNTGKITTPGSLIEDQLSHTLGQYVTNVGLAKDLDAILGALVGQIINQVIGGVGGLAGASDSRSDNGSGQSAVDRGLQQTVDSIIAASKQAQTLPDGFYMDTTAGKLTPTGANGTTPTDFCTQFRKNIYGTNLEKGAPAYATTPIWVKVDGTTDKTATAIPTSKTGAPPNWTVADYNKLARFCANINLTAPIAGETAEFNKLFSGTGQTVTPSITPTVTAPRVTDRQIRLNSAKLNQSHIYGEGTNDSRGPINAVTASGRKDSNTQDGNAPHWWSATLNQPEIVNSISVKSTLGLGTGVKIILANVPEDKKETKEPVGSVTLAETQSYIQFQYPTANPAGFTKTENNNDDFTITLQNPVLANALVIYNDNTKLSLLAVKLYRPATDNGNNQPGSGESVVPSRVISLTAPSDSNNVALNAGRGQFSKTLTLLSNQSQTGLKAQVKLLKYVSGATTGAALNFSTAFRTLDITKGNVTAPIKILQGGEDAQRCLTFSCTISIVTGLTQSTPNVVIYDASLSLTANVPITFTFTGFTSFTATRDQYALVVEIIDTSGVAATSYTATFGIQ